MEAAIMKRFLGALWIVCAGAVAHAESSVSASVVTTRVQRVAETLQQLERDWADAEYAGNSGKLERIVADDWTGMNSHGRKLTKEQLLALVRSSKVKSVSIEWGPMDVKLLGNIAVVQGSEIERSTDKGAYASGEVVWMDVFALRDGKWVAVRSQSARTGLTYRPRWPI
jgi:hypothetical protein